MRRLSLAAAFVILLACAFLRHAASQSNFTQQLAPGVYYRAADRENKIIANAGWVVFRDYVLVIDANYPWGARAILADVRKTTDKQIRFVFDTHYTPTTRSETACTWTPAPPSSARRIAWRNRSGRTLSPGQAT